MNVPKIRYDNFTKEWKKVKLSSQASFLQGLTYTPNDVSNDGTMVLRSSNIQNSMVDYNDIVRVNIIIPEKLKIKENDILMCVRNGSKSLVGKTAWLSKNEEKCTWGAFMNIIRPKEKNKFVYYYLNSKYFYNHVWKDLGTATVNQITKQTLESCYLNIPSIEEQEKISNTLSLLDQKIKLQSKKIEDLKLFKLYTKNQIFNDYDEVHKLKDILVKWNKKNKNNSVKYVESISNKYGFISQTDQFEDRNVASKNLNNYYIIEKGVFGYNPSRLNVGSLALKTNDKISVVSPLYECFTTSQNNQYLLEWFDSKYFKKETISKFEGGVRNTLNFSNLCEIEIRLPTIEKQNKYSNIFKMFNNKIELEVKKLYKLHELKKGLMQSMFV